MKRTRYVRRGTPKAGPVTVRKVDGTTEQRSALRPREVENTVRRGERKPRTWDQR